MIISYITYHFVINVTSYLLRWQTGYEDFDDSSFFHKIIDTNKLFDVLTYFW